MKFYVTNFASVVVFGTWLILNGCVSNEGIVVKGKILTVQKEPLPQADIHVNGKKATADAAGSFNIKVPKKDKYVVTVSRPGYRIMSEVFLKGIPVKDWVLGEAQTTKADPTRRIIATDQRTDCGKATMARVRWQDHPAARMVKQVQPDGSLADAPPVYEAAVANYLATVSCNTGATVRIPANALEDESRQTPSGLVNVSVYTINLNSPSEMPGDLTVRTEKGGGYMKSYGAMGIDITNAQGKPLQLKEGATAQISIPIDPSLKGSDKSPDPTIPLLFYNMETTAWEVQGELKLDSSRTAYQTQVNHFSAYNSDVVKTDQACLRIDASAIAGDFGLTLGVLEYIGAPVTAVRNFTVINTPNCNGQKIHAIYNLPQDMIVMIFAYQPVDRSGDVTPIVSITFTTTEGTQVPSNPNEPVCPYAACQGQTFVLTPLPPSP
jgi:hypothetical protein